MNILVGNSTIQTLPVLVQYEPEGNIYKGTPETTIGYSNIHTCLSVTQNGTLNIKQSIDGILWDITDTYNIIIDNGNNTKVENTTVAIKEKYCKVEFTNTGVVASSIRLLTFMS